MSVAPINELSISGSSASLTINSATAGASPNSTGSTGFTYAITTNQANKKITGSIDSNMPSGTTLNIILNAPHGATSAGVQALSTTATTLVTGISKLAQSGLAMTLGFATQPSAGVINSFNRTITLTLLDGP